MAPILDRVYSKYNNILADVTLKTGLNLNKPSFICAKMTMRCNSRCVHCNIWDMNFDEQEMTTEQWCWALDGLYDWLGRFHMVFTGGEALLRDDMIDILSYAAGKGIYVELLSNSILVDDLMAHRIIQAGVAQFTTSFDGITPETHDNFRGGSGFHARTLAAITALCNLRQNKEKPIKIILKTVISSNNLEELAAIARFSKENGLDVLYQPIEQNYGEEPNADWYKDSSLWIRDVVKLKEEISQLLHLKRHGYPILNSADDFATIIRYFESPDELMAAVQAHDTKSSTDTCRHAVTNFVISSNGDVRMCFKMDPIGNLRDSPPRVIWNKRTRCWLKPCAFR